MGPGLGAEMNIGIVEELDGVFETALPQQRGLSPSTLAGPRDIETHVADEIALLDHLGWERAWFIGHGWGGHLAMHVAVAHPDRRQRADPARDLGAVPDGGVAALNEALVGRLTAEERARLRFPARRATSPATRTRRSWARSTARSGRATRPSTATWRPPGTIRLEQPIPDQPDTMTSVRAHFETGTLEKGLPRLDLPALLIHGDGDPMPLTATNQTADLLAGSAVRIVEGAGHFPWVERRGVVREMVVEFLATTAA